MQPMEIVPANAGEYLPHAVPWTREDFQTLFEAGLLPHFCQLINGMIVSTGCYSTQYPAPHVECQRILSSNFEQRPY